MPNARTPTTATESVSTGGCWDAFAISQAEVAVSATPATSAAGQVSQAPGAEAHLPAPHDGSPAGPASSARSMSLRSRGDAQAQAMFERVGPVETRERSRGTLDVTVALGARTR